MFFTAKINFNFCILGKHDAEDLRREEMDKFTELYVDWKGPDEMEKDSSYKRIPKFFRKVSSKIIIKIESIIYSFLIKLKDD